jgi:tRNA nucleotidyltransferase (CCA-adding enzyme)
LLTSRPSAFFETLRDCEALAVIAPEIDKLAGVPQPRQWHPEVDSFIHTMMVLEQASQLNSGAPVRFAALCHDLGKATTPAEILPSHHGHEERGAQICDQLCQRLRVPKRVHELAMLSTRYHTHCHRALELNARTLVKTLRALDIKRKPDRFKEFLVVCEADARGRLGHEHTDYPQSAFFADAGQVFCSIDTAAIAKASTSTSAIADDIYQAQLKSIKLWLAESEKPYTAR